VSKTIDLSGRVAVVTGGTRGIGLAVAEALAAAGADVVPTARTEKAVTEAADQIVSYGVRSLAIPTDVAQTDEVKALFEETATELDGVDIVVNNAGINPRAAMGSAESVEPSAFERPVEVNLQGAYNCAHEAGTYLLENDGGTVINMSSVSGVVGTPGQHAYTASKHGLVGLSKSLALDWAPEVRVNAIAPGYVRTDLTAELTENESLHESVLEDVPSDRFAEPEEIADVTLFLASDMASYITGECVVVDGGWTAQ
jgi:NAD(P)-dependent dehydrogenase (short-subunit alcohol dehydrogenase family)